MVRSRSSQICVAIGVVRDDEEREIRVEEKSLEPPLGRLVQVVRRLVQHEHVGVRQQQVRERDTHAVSAGKVLNRSRKIGFREAQAGENPFGFMFWIQVAVCGIQDGFSDNGFEFLRKVADTEARAFADGAFIGRFLA